MNATDPVRAGWAAGLRESEQAVVGAAMADTATAQAAATAGLVHTDFEDPGHRAIWAAIAEGLATSGGTDLVDVFTRLQKAGQADDCGGLKHLHELSSGGAACIIAGQPQRVLHHVKRIQQAAHARRLLGLAEDIAAGRVTANGVAHAQAELLALQAAVPDVGGFVLPLSDGQASEPDPWSVVPVADLDAADIEPQGWLWGRYLPTREVTLLGAHGGAGKSWVSLMIAVCVAAGIPLFGQATVRAPVVVFSAEDDAQTLRRRLRTICAAMGVPAEGLADSMLLLDASDGDALLFDAPHLAAGPVGAGMTSHPHTHAFRALQRAVLARPGALVIVDNASETFAGNENARQDVRAFVRQLRTLARMVDAAVLLLAHVDKASARGLGAGQSYSGSTAWHNSARSRLALSRDKDGLLALEHDKSTHAMPHPPLRLQWVENGLPEPVEADSPLTMRLTAQTRITALLRLVHEFHQRGESVRTSEAGSCTAPQLLKGQPGYPADLRDADVLRLLRDAERLELLVREPFTTENRKVKERWVLTGAGLAQIGPGRASVAPVSHTPPHPPCVTGAHTGTCVPVAENMATGATGATGAADREVF